MAVTLTTAITSQTAAANSSSIVVDAGASIQVFCNPRLQAQEKVTLQRSTDEGTTWVDVAEFGNNIVLNQGIQSNVIAGPGTFRLQKTVTETATAVYYDA